MEPDPINKINVVCFDAFGTLVEITDALNDWELKPTQLRSDRPIQRPRTSCQKCCYTKSH